MNTSLIPFAIGVGINMGDSGSQRFSWVLLTVAEVLDVSMRERERAPQKCYHD